MQLYKKIAINILALFRSELLRFKKNKQINLIEGIIFSKDRPIQLFALLESYYKNCLDPKPLNIIFNASNLNYKNAYDDIANTYKQYPIIFIQEDDFRKTLINSLGKIISKYVFFLVDDDIFTRQFSFNDFFSIPNHKNFIFSFRLGANLKYCYTKAQNQNLPYFRKIDKFISWDWSNGEHDWNYIFSVDGNIYSSRVIYEMAKLIPFKAPNSFEANMNVFRYIFRRKKGLCYPESVLVNLCLNRVQNEVNNIAGDISVSELLEIWRQNKKINTNHFEGISNISAHIEVNELPLINKK